MAVQARIWVALLAVPCAIGFVPAGTCPGLSRATALRAGARSVLKRRLLVAAALSDDKDIKPSDALRAASQETKDEYVEAAMEAVTEAGRKELEDLAALNKQEQEELQKQLTEEITLAMTGASIEMLEEYDTKTQAILENMKKDRDIIREETANLERLAKQMETPLWWKKGDNAPKEGELGSNKFSVPMALAYMFGFAGANELYQMWLADEGIQFIGGAKAIFDLFLATVSGGIAFRKKKAPIEK